VTKKQGSLIRRIIGTFHFQYGTELTGAAKKLIKKTQNEQQLSG